MTLTTIRSRHWHLADAILLVALSRTSHPPSIRQIEQPAPAVRADIALHHLARSRLAEERARTATQTAAGRILILRVHSGHPHLTIRDRPDNSRQHQPPRGLTLWRHTRTADCSAQDRWLRNRLSGRRSGPGSPPRRASPTHITAPNSPRKPPS